MLTQMTHRCISSIKPVNQFVVNRAVHTIQEGVVDIQTWMTKNMLKLNADKTEILLIGSRSQLCKFTLEYITIGGVSVVV